MLSVRTPHADTGITSFDSANLLIAFFHIVDVHLACIIAEASDQHKFSMWGEENCVPWTKGEAVNGVGFAIEDGGFSWRVAVHHAEFF